MMVTICRHHSKKQPPIICPKKPPIANAGKIELRFCAELVRIQVCADAKPKKLPPSGSLEE